LTQELKSKEKRKGSSKKGLEEKRGKKGVILGESYPRERKEEREKRRSTRTTSKDVQKHKQSQAVHPYIIVMQ